MSGPVKCRSWMNWRLVCPCWRKERWGWERRSLPRFARERLHLRMI